MIINPSSVKDTIDTCEQLIEYIKLIMIGDLLELYPEREIYHLTINQIIKPNTIDAIFTIGVCKKEC